MYESYWNLNHRPFEPASASNSYYPCEAHQGAMLKLRYAVETRAAAALLVGESGLGKTLIVGLLEHRMGDANSPWVWLRYSQLAPGELLATVADGFDAAGSNVGDHRLETSVRRITEALKANAERGRHAVLVVDEAQSLPGADALEALRLLANLSTVDGAAQLTILLVGQATLLPRLDRSPAFEQRLSVKCVLRPLSLEETASYVTHRLTAAGACREIFDNSALEAIHRLCQGNPRRINRLADLALLVGYADELERITAAEIESVSSDLVALTAPA